MRVSGPMPDTWKFEGETMFIINILAFVFVLGLVILLHELGHFIMAKRAGILCHEFSIGMGPVLYSKKRGETVYSIRAIPIGGFVMMAGEEINEDMVKVGNTIKVLRKDGEITHMILNEDDPRYEDAETITVNQVDLSGKDDRPLTLNGEPVNEKAYYVFKKKKLQVAPFERSFESKSLTQRFLAIFAGPFMNFVLALFLFIMVAMIVGFPVEDEHGRITTEIGVVSEDMPADGVIKPGDVIIAVEGDDDIDSWQRFSEVMQHNRGTRELNITVRRDGEEVELSVVPNITIISIGITSAREPDDPHEVKIGPVQNNTPAIQAGFETGDIIRRVDGTDVDNWSELLDIMHANEAGDPMVFEVEREDGSMDTIEIEPYGRSLLESQGASISRSTIGVSPVHERNLARSVPAGFGSLRSASTMIFDTLRMLFGGTVGVGDLAGPVGIYTITTSAFQQGLITFFNWTALLSVNLGILNLLPIPALDGGRLVFLGYEAVTRRKVNKTVENYLHFIMFILLIGLLLVVTYNDILRLLNLR